MGKPKNNNLSKIPGIDKNAIHELKSDIPRKGRTDWSEPLAYVCFALASLAVYKSIGSLLWVAFYTLLSLIINRNYNSGLLPTPFLMLGFTCFLIYVYYKLLLFGFRDR